jgi:hypothetical protein
MIPCNFWYVNANMRKLLKQSTTSSEACWNSWSWPACKWVSRVSSLLPTWDLHHSQCTLEQPFFVAKFSELAESIFKMAKHMCILCFLVDKLLQAFFWKYCQIFLLGFYHVAKMWRNHLKIKQFDLLSIYLFIHWHANIEISFIVNMASRFTICYMFSTMPIVRKSLVFYVQLWLVLVVHVFTVIVFEFNPVW